VFELDQRPNEFTYDGCAYSYDAEENSFKGNCDYRARYYDGSTGRFL
jgi:hypothetical protein